MELIALLLAVYLLVIPILALNYAKSARQRVNELEAEVGRSRMVTREREDLLRRIRHLEILVKGAPEDAVRSGEKIPVALPVETVRPAIPPRRETPPPVPATPAGPLMTPPATIPGPVIPVSAKSQTPPQVPVPAAAAGLHASPPFPKSPAEPPPAGKRPASPPPEPKPAISLEQFMGAKLFAWVGGLALFLGLVFFVKLSIDRGWISAELRTGIGFVTGLGLVIAGIRINGKKAYAVLGQTLCATGIVALYGMTFAAHAYYKFPFFANPLVAFGLMAAITTTAFLLAVRMSAQVVGVLGMAGGFLTPIVCSTGQDNPLGLFGYISMLDLGVLAVAKRCRWHYLIGLTAAGTVLMQAGWFSKFFHAEGYAYGAKTWVAVAVFVGFAALFTAALKWLTNKTGDGEADRNSNKFPSVSAVSMCVSAMVAAFAFLGYDGIVERPGLLYTFVFLINLVVMGGAWANPVLGAVPVLTGLVTFLHLNAWTFRHLTTETLPAALGVYLVFGLLHTVYAVLSQRRTSTPPLVEAAWIPVTVLLLLMVPVLQIQPAPMMVWPAILLVNLAIIGTAIVSRSLKPVAGALVLTMLTAGCWLFNLPDAGAESLTKFLSVVGGFAFLFGAASTWLARLEHGDRESGDIARILPVCSAVLPFVLLIMAVLRLNVTDITPVFGFAALLSVFLLGLGTFTRNTGLPLAALVCVLALEGVWHGRSFDPAAPVTPLLWYLGFYVLFSLHPHLFRRRLAATVLPWVSAAVAGPGTFLLVYSLVKTSWPNDMMGLLPAAFAVPALISLFAVLRLHSADNPARLTQLAWFGSVALGFITLIFPLQYENQWLTVSWALEGAALCWLFRYVPHPALPRVGAALLVVAFARLAVNPAVLSYQVRGDTAILNWQLYAYGVSAAAMFMGSRWLARSRFLEELKVPNLFTVLGGILIFLLLNIEIADAFTPPGSASLVLEFSGNFARDMTYSIAWGLFALGLLVIGFAKGSPQTRYAGIGLLAVTLLKLFLHDLAQIESAYRIGALIVVALIALAASFLYQRYFSRSESESAREP